jgi:hypothetical protein
VRAEVGGVLRGIGHDSIVGAPRGVVKCFAAQSKGLAKAPRRALSSGA